MTAWLLATITCAPAHGADDVEPGAAGYRVTAVSPTHRVSVAQTAVVGPDGHMVVTSAQAGLRLRDLVVGLSLPFASWRAAAGPQVGLGNVGIEGWFLPVDAGRLAAIGIVAHVESGGRAFTWAHRPEELWPGTGADLVARLALHDDGDLVVMAHLSGGLHSATAYAPYPGFYPRLQAALLLDRDLPGAAPVGVVGEATVSYWDTSPVEIAGLVRGDPSAGLRLRAGLVLPLATWIGTTPSSRAAGVREATLHADLSIYP